MKCYMSIVAILMVMASAISCRIEKDTDNGKVFYQYTENEITNLLRKHGYHDVNIHYVMRNADGTKLRIYDSDRRIFILSCKEGLKVKYTLGLAWLDENDQVVAWFDSKKRKVFYRNGFVEDPPFWFYSIDPSGSYFGKRGEFVLKQTRFHTTENVRIYSLDKPDTALIELDGMDKDIINIYQKHGRIYVFGTKNHVNTGVVLQKVNNKLAIADTIHINKDSALFQVIDFCPWSDEVMFVEPLDWPYKSKLYAFNLRTREIRNVGTKNGYGFYLQCDILAEYRNLLKERPQGRDRLCSK